MSGAELGLAVVGVLPACYLVGKELLETCKAFQQADNRLTDIILRVEACWFRVERQLQIIEKMAPLMAPRHLDIQEAALERFRGKLELTNSKLAGMKKEPSHRRVFRGVEIRRLKYAVARSSLSQAVSELEQWCETLDPTWFLIMKVAGPQIDSELKSNAIAGMAVASRNDDGAISDARQLRRALNTNSDDPEPATFLSQDSLAPDTIHAIPFSAVRRAHRPDPECTVLLDPISGALRPSDQSVLTDISNFSRRLRNANPFTFGLLECQGILRREAGDSRSSQGSDPKLSFMFHLPATHTSAQSVRGRLLSGPGKVHDSLSGRFALARQLARALAYVHIYGFVHKNIRPETILILGGTDTADGAGSQRKDRPKEISVLVGFDVLRNAEGNTGRLGDSDWCRNLYRHPSRQGNKPKVDYEMRHDIYSVGVCLLEIGLWTSFVEEEEIRTPASGFGTLAGLLGYDTEEPDRILKDPYQTKDRLEQLARGKLRRQMGTKYSKVVETCLTCLDDGNEDFGHETEAEEGVALGARYIENVVAKLGEIVV